MESPKSFNINVKDQEILHAVHSIKYGTVLVVIQNSEVVQIESTNKRRFDTTIAEKTI